MNPLTPMYATTRLTRVSILLLFGLGLGLLAGWRTVAPTRSAAPGTALRTAPGPVMAQSGREWTVGESPLAPSAAEAVGARWLSFPIVDRNWRSLCDAELVVQNSGAEPSKAVWLTWPMGSTGCGLTEEGPTSVVCSGMIAPGGTWSAPSLPPGQTSSAMLFSFSMQRVGEAGIGGGLSPSDLVGDAMCAVLTERVVGDPIAFQRFLQAFAEGGSFDGIELPLAYGANLEAELTRHCADRSAERPTRAAYKGVPAGRLLPPEPGVDPAAPVYRVPMPESGASAWVQNAGWTCATVEILVRPSATGDECGDPPPPVACGEPLVLSPGQTRSVAVFRCGSERGTSSLELRSTGPLAVVVDAMAALDQSMGSYAYNQLDAGDALSAPLALPPEEFFWRNRVLIQNTDSLPRDLRVQRRDLSGDVFWSTQVMVCPQQVSAVEFPDDMIAPGTSGSVDVAVLAGSLGPEPAGITALVEHFTLDRWHDRALYPMSRDRAQASPVARNGVIAIPRLTRGAEVNTELMLLNAVDAPGETHVVLYLYDANGLVDFECHGLAEREALHFDARSWRTDLGTGAWSALVSATYWSHEVFDASGTRIGNPVDLKATTTERELVHLGPAGGHGEAMASLHQPPSREDVLTWSLPPLPICPAMPTLPRPSVTPEATRTPTATLEATATATPSIVPSSTPDPSRQPPGQIYLPLLLATVDTWPTAFILIADTSPDEDSAASLEDEAPRGKLDATRRIGSRALRSLRAGTDLAGVVRYGSEGSAELYALSEDPAEIAARLSDFQADRIRATTRPDLALAVAVTAFGEMPSRYAGRALLLFVDGRSQSVHLERAADRAATLRAGGVRVFVIASDALDDGALLEAIAGQPGRLLRVALDREAEVQRALATVEGWAARGWAAGTFLPPQVIQPMQELPGDPVDASGPSRER